MAQKTAKEKKNREIPLWTRARVAILPSAMLQQAAGSRHSSTSPPSRQAASWGRRSMDSPARYWVVNRASRRMGRAWVQQAERLVYR